MAPESSSLAVQSNLYTINTLGTPKLWPLLTGVHVQRCSLVQVWQYISGSQPGVREKSQGERQFKNNTKIFNKNNPLKLTRGYAIFIFSAWG